MRADDDSTLKNLSQFDEWFEKLGCLANLGVLSDDGSVASRGNVLLWTSRDPQGRDRAAADGDVRSGVDAHRACAGSETPFGAHRGGPGARVVQGRKGADYDVLTAIPREMSLYATNFEVGRKYIVMGNPDLIGPCSLMYPYEPLLRHLRQHAEK